MNVYCIYYTNNIHAYMKIIHITKEEKKAV